MGQHIGVNGPPKQKLPAGQQDAVMSQMIVVLGHSPSRLPGPLYPCSMPYPSMEERPASSVGVAEVERRNGAIILRT